MLDQVETVLSEDAMEHIVTIICVRYALHEVLYRCLHGHEERKEEAPVREYVAETVHEEEKDGDHLCGHCARHKLCQDNLSASMGQSTMPKE